MGWYNPGGYSNRPTGGGAKTSAYTPRSDSIAPRSNNTAATLAALARAAAANRAQSDPAAGVASGILSAARNVGVGGASNAVGGAQRAAPLAAGIGAASANTGINSVLGGIGNALGTTSPSSGSGYRGGVTSPSGNSVAPPVTTPPTPTPPPTVAPTAPPVTAPGVPTPATRSFTTNGGFGTAGSFNRQRLNRGPRSGMSMTPEMLMRLARQRYSQQG